MVSVEQVDLKYSSCNTDLKNTFTIKMKYKKITQELMVNHLKKKKHELIVGWQTEISRLKSMRGLLC